MNAITRLNTNGILRRTQHVDHVESFYGKTFDNHSVCVAVYQKDNSKWFVFLAPQVAGWTNDAMLAFEILHNVSVYKLKELIQ